MDAKLTVCADKSGLVEFIVSGVALGHSHSLGPHQVLVFEGRTLQVDDSLGPQGDMKDPPDLNVHLCRAKDHHVVVLWENTHKCCYYGQLVTALPNLHKIS